MSEAQQHRLALPQGTRIRDFEFHQVLGSGGFGITYLGLNITLDIPVAIKEYLPADLATREQDLSVVPQTAQAASDFQWGLERFLDEARTLARFQHPNIVRVHHFFEAHSTAYIVMDHVKGEDLSAYLTRKGMLSEDELKGILYPLLDGLEEVHRADFLHRDIKPGNIVLRDSDGSPVLLDFGAARQAIGAKSRSITSIVTPGYAPIEQYSSRGDQGPWTDLYALGGVCYRALTGQVPDDAMDRVRDDPLIPVSQRCAGWVSGDFLSAIDKALSVDERNRPQNIGDWREELEEEERQDTDSEIVDTSPTLKDADRLNTWFKLHCICFVSTLVFSIMWVAADNARLDKDNALVVSFLCVVSFLLAGLFGCLILHKLWSLIPTHKAKTTPDKAVGFLFVPVFNFYWNFVAIHGLAKALNAESGRKSVSEVACFIYCYLFVVVPLVAIIEDQSWILAIGYIVGGVIWFAVLGQMKNAGRLILQSAKA